jgi:hypothetical protein
MKSLDKKLREEIKPQITQIFADFSDVRTSNGSIEKPILIS